MLYLWMGHADGRGGQAQLAWSSDHARTWEFADWKFAEFGLVGFINFGRNYAGPRDDYVYAYSHDDPKADTPADRFILMRVPKDEIIKRDAYEFFAGLDAAGLPRWTREISLRAAVFEHQDACLRSAMTWNPGLRRYFWWQHIPQPTRNKDRGDTRFEGGFGIYDAPEPWALGRQRFSRCSGTLGQENTGTCQPSGLAKTAVQLISSSPVTIASPCAAYNLNFARITTILRGIGVADHQGACCRWRRSPLDAG